MSVMAVLCFVGCGEKAGGPGNNGGNGGKPGNGGSGSGVTPPTPTKLFMFDEEMNPKYSSRTEALDTIFNPDELGELVLVFDRSEWDKHLYYCDKSGNQHEDSVHAKGFYFKKDNKEWFFKDIGFRIRGNTSRRRPQEGNGVGNNDYVQAHFALDFEEWITDEQDEAGVEKKLADSMKGVILKRFKDDPTYSREIYSYNLFRKNGIWVAPRASYTTLKIQIVDDLDLDKDGDKTEYETVNYGVYGMIEEIKKQFLKERTTEEGGGEFSNNKGNLWKCLGANFKNTSSVGKEDVHFEFDEDGNITNFVRETFDYDYKSDNFDSAKTQLLDFIAALNTLPDCTDGNNDDADIETIKDFYTNKMDGDLFLRTYAINVILGMWDDYWINNNNFYFYFDKKTEKAYFIPYDYDNSLGVSHLGVDAGTHNPLKWGNLTDGNHPLIQKILQVPEYMDLYKNYLLEYSDANSHFDDDKSITQIKKWHEMIKPYINSTNLRYHDTTSYLEDKTNATWGDTYRDYKLITPGKMNYFTVRQKAIKACINPSNEKLTLTLTAGDGTFSSGETTCTFEFTEGTTLAEVLDVNDFEGWKIQTDEGKYTFYGNVEYSYIKDGVYYYPWCFIDSEGNEIYEENFSEVTLFEDTTLNSLYKKYVPITFDLNPILDISEEFYLLEELDIAELGVSSFDDYVFLGWTFTPNGTDFVTKVPSSPVTLYAKWLSKDELVLPYEFSEDLSKITFIFRPSDYNVSLSSSTNYNVYLMSSFTLPDGWPESNCSEHNRLIKGNDGNYRLTLNTSEVYNNWHGFQFFVKGVQWCGVKQYKQIVTSENFEDDCFMVLFPEPTISFDLNGGTSTAYIEDLYSTQYDISQNINNFFRWNVCYDNPTKDGFAFAGWTLTKDGDDFVDTIPFGKITVYAKWVEIQELKLTLISDENSWFVKDDVEHEDLELTFTTGQTFNEILNSNNCWLTMSTSSDGYYESTYVDAFGEVIEHYSPLIEDATVYVKTKFVPYIYITLYANGGTFGNGDETCDLVTSEGNWIGNEPTKDGCIFIGWDNKFGERVEYASSKNTLLYAQYWDVFTNADIIGNMTYNNGESLTKIDDNTYSYTFTYSTSMSGEWGTSNGEVAFKLRPNHDWDGTQFGSPNILEPDDFYFWCGQGEENIVARNLENGVSYTITFWVNKNSVWVKIATAE